MKSEIRPGILKTADSSGVPGSESPAGLAASPGVGGSIDSNLGIVGSSFMDTFRMSCTDCNRSVLDSAEREENDSNCIVRYKDIADVRRMLHSGAVSELDG